MMPRTDAHYGNPQTVFTAQISNDSIEGSVLGHGAPFETVLEPSTTRRDRFQLRVCRTYLTFGMPGYDLWWVDDDIRELPFDRAVVQLIHHSAHSTTACGHGAARATAPPFCLGNTWHWGNVEIQPSVPFTLLHGDRAYVDATTTDTVNFDVPAPADAHLRFLAFGMQTQISFDGGASWQLAQTKRQWPRQDLKQSGHRYQRARACASVPIRG
jgi:hypothetical protein